MIKESSISTKAKNYVQGKLSELAARRDIRILLAIESGSRAWGFPSADSDYDVRFIYTRSKEDYLSIHDYRDVIETPIVDDLELTVPLDLNGWDIKKALRLGVKSNAVLAEWVSSPIQYMSEDSFKEPFIEFLKESADLGWYRYHYSKLAINAWKQIEEQSDKIKVKLYCYAIRPALMLEWMEQNGTIPPMDLYSLNKGMDIDDSVLGQIEQIIEKKVSADEKDLIDHITSIDGFIEKVLERNIERPLKNEPTDDAIQKANEMFLRMLRISPTS